MSSNNNYSHYMASSSFSYTSSSSSSSSSSNPQGSTTRYTQQTYSNSRDGTTVHRTHSETGRPTLEETRHYPVSGFDGRIEGGGRGENGDMRRIEDVTGTEEGEEVEESGDAGRRDTEREREREREEQEKRDREYEERMEDEYAKREGGA